MSRELDKAQDARGRNLDSELDRRLSALMLRAQDGDREAYATLLGEVTALVRVFVCRRVRDSASVEDIVQETLISLHRDRHTYDPTRAFGPWCYAIARHRLLDFTAKQRRRAAFEVRVDGPTAELGRADPFAGQVTLPGFLQQALALLSGAQREVIRLLKVEGYSVAEIAVRTGRSEASVKVTAHRGYRHLRRLMSSHD